MRPVSFFEIRVHLHQPDLASIFSDPECIAQHEEPRSRTGEAQCWHSYVVFPMGTAGKPDSAPRRELTSRPSSRHPNNPLSPGGGRTLGERSPREVNVP